MKKQTNLSVNTFPLLVVALIGFVFFAGFLISERIQDASVLAEKQMRAKALGVAYRLGEELAHGCEGVRTLALNPLVLEDPQTVENLLAGVMERSSSYQALLVIEDDGSLVAEVPPGSYVQFVKGASDLSRLTDQYELLSLGDTNGKPQHLFATAARVDRDIGRSERRLVALADLDYIIEMTLLGYEEDDVVLSTEDGRELVLFRREPDERSLAPGLRLRMLNLVMGETPECIRGTARMPKSGWSVTVARPYQLFLSDVLNESLSGNQFYRLLFLPVVIMLSVVILAVNNSRRYFQELSKRDGLTGLYNHRFFQTELRQNIANRDTPRISFLMIDIDDFKQFNDTYGHQAGDQMLARISNLLLTSVRDTDIVARYGGEEFAIILFDIGPEEAFGIAERIRKAVKEECNITVSIGISSFPDCANTVEELIKGADEALYMAKGLSKDRVVGIWTMKECDADA